MKIIVYAMALFSAFFVSFSYSSDGEIPFVAPKGEQGWCAAAFGVEACGRTRLEAYNLACEAYIAVASVPEPTSSDWGHYYTCKAGDSNNNPKRVLHYYSYCQFCENKQQENSRESAITWTNVREEETFTCPPDIYPEYTNQQASTEHEAGFVCVKPTENPDPDPDEPDPNDNGCDEFGNNSFLPPSSGIEVPEGGSVCHTLDNGTQCAYKKNPFGTGYEQTGQACSGEEPEYPPPQLPPPNPEDPWACATVGSVEHFAVCPIDPTKECNPLVVTGDGGEQTQYQCASGCGSVNGQYVCVHEDKNGNGIPDKDETDPNNPDPDNPDPDNPDPNNPDEGESPDTTRTNTLLTGIDGKIGIGNSRLSDIKNGIEGMTNEQKKGNGSLAAIASNTAKTANNTKGTSENTAEILKSISETDVSNTFNPESAASFYESEYEDGFGGVWQEKSGEFQQTEAYQFLQQFKFNGGGAAPDTSICFNLGQFMDFGCSELPVPDAGLLAILKVFILISAAFLCRKLIFGG